MLKGWAIAAVILLGALRGVAQTQTPVQVSSQEGAPAKHSVAVKFDYDFRLTPACTAKIKKGCVQQFVVYDISAGEAKRSKLFTIPAPQDATGAVTGIAGTSPPLSFESGKHLLEVVAQYPDGTESQARACTTWVTIP
ncbi:MAG: hypothetical protein ABR973_05020 [Candidatus Acidiferrales bacterium]|jgi:hypothetical protein